MNNRKRGPKAPGSALGLALALSIAVAGCDGILDIEVPGQVTLDESFVPSQAQTLVNSAITDIECALSDFIAFEAAGYEDTTTRTVGWWGGRFERPTTPGTGSNCSSSETGVAWFNPLHKGRWMAEETYRHLAEEWTAEEVPEREELMGTAAIYAGIAYAHLGEHFCEVTADAGPLMSWSDALQEAEQWYTTALGHIGTAGDFAVPPSEAVTTSAAQMAYLLRARARLARGETTLALEDAQQVTQGFRSNISRDSGAERHRWNRPYSAHTGLGWVALLGPVDWWDGGPNPVTGEAWPEVIPFTGYWDLAVLPDGRAVSDTGHPITLDDTGAVADVRVPVEQQFDPDTGEPAVGGDSDYPLWEQRKFTSPGQAIPLAKWEEAWLIQAEILGGQDAIDLVNDIRSAHDLPLVTYLDPSDDEGIRRMVIEELRRTHFLEGRFWSTKLRNDDLLWFPRGEGTDMWGFSYLTGVRMVMPGGEFTQNPNLEDDDQGSLCPPHQDPTT